MWHGGLLYFVLLGNRAEEIESINATPGHVQHSREIKFKNNSRFSSIQFYCSCEVDMFVRHGLMWRQPFVSCREWASDDDGVELADWSRSSPSRPAAAPAGRAECHGAAADGSSCQRAASERWAAERWNDRSRTPAFCIRDHQTSRRLGSFSSVELRLPCVAGGNALTHICLFVRPMTQQVTGRFLLNLGIGENLIKFLKVGARVRTPATRLNKHKNTKSRFSHLLRHLAWKRRGLILVLVLHEFVTGLLRHLSTYLQPRTHTGQKMKCK